MPKIPIILIKFASRSRPEKFFAGIENIISMANDIHHIKILVTADTDDATMYNRDVVTKLKPYIESKLLTIKFGESKNKIDAVNRDMEHAGKFDILLVYSDDMEFIQKGYDDTIRDKFAIHFPDFDGNLHFNDGFQPRVSTMTIMGKPYLDMLNGKIYNPLYKSLYCDEEYTIAANKLMKMQYFPQVIFKHNHAVNVGTVPDALLIHTESLGETDKIVFDQRVLEMVHLNGKRLMNFLAK